MTTVSTAASPGISLFQSKTVIASVLGLLALVLPNALTWLGFPLAQQPQIISLINEIGPPAAALAAIVFRAIATRQVTSIMPKPTIGRPTAMLLILLLAAPIVALGGGGLMVGCVTQTPHYIAGMTLAGIEDAVQVGVAAANTAIAAGVTSKADDLTIAGVEKKIAAGLVDLRAAYGASASGNTIVDVSAVAALLVQLYQLIHQPAPSAVTAAAAAHH